MPQTESNSQPKGLRMTKMWKERVERAKKEYKQWDNARKKRLKEYKSLWKAIENKRRELKEVWDIWSKLSRKVYGVAKIVDSDEKTLAKRFRFKPLKHSKNRKGVLGDVV